MFVKKEAFFLLIYICYELNVEEFLNVGVSHLKVLRKKNPLTSAKGSINI